jgi:glucose-6-phosphate 1-dehydrogenase
MRALGQAGLPAGSRLVVEKPFGNDQVTARALNQLLAEVTDEEHIFRVDHFLAKQTVQNVLGLRFANRIFEPIWNSGHIKAVDIVWNETVTLEGRAGYYDRAGALRDMLQNHLLQLLCLVAMEPPQTLSPRDLRDRKVDVLRAVRALAHDEVARDTTVPATPPVASVIAMCRTTSPSQASTRTGRRRHTRP